MKIEHLKSRILKNKQRVGVTLLFCACLFLLVFTPGAAQLKEQKHVTAIQLGGAAEGSRVTVVSDAPLVDYEAFRRGDRFYVRVPLADMNSAAPHFRADGFEDVQVQKVGDSLIVSFKLQAGASARVDQRGNRLDVIFSAANRSVTRPGSQATIDRGPDAAGPMPSDSASSSRPRVTSGRTGSVNESRAPGDPRWQPRLKTDVNKNSNKAVNNQLTSQVAHPSPSPFSSPSSMSSPGYSASYTPLTSSTPPASASSSPAVGSGSSNSQSWRNRVAAARQWMSANRLATLVAALILLSLIVYLVSAIRRKQKTDGKSRRAKAPKVQPKYSADQALNELPKSGASEQTPRREAVAEAAASRASEATPDYERPRILTQPTIVSPSVGQEEQSSEEEEREVFEL